MADIDGVRDNAIKLLGTKDSYVEIPRSKLLDTTKSITIILSVYPTGDEGDIFTYRTTGGGVSLLQRESSQGTTSTVFIRFIKRSLKLLEALEDDVLVKNEWNIIATSYDYQTGDAKLYRNGKHIKTINIGTNYIATQFPIRLGAIQKSLTPYKGHLSCLQIYDFAMDIKDIIQSQYVCRKGKHFRDEVLLLNFSQTDVHVRRYNVYNAVSLINFWVGGSVVSQSVNPGGERIVKKCAIISLFPLFYDKYKCFQTVWLCFQYDFIKATPI